MDILNSIGFINFWGVTPFYNIFENNKEILSTQKEVNVLISDSNDIRHFLYTVYKWFKDQSENDKTIPKINFYIHERNWENWCRHWLFIHWLTDRTKSIIERSELLMEIYGNTLLPSRAIDYIDKVYKKWISFLSRDKKAKELVYENIIDISNLSYKEIDHMVETLTAYNSKIPYDIEKYRDDRVRYSMKDRYDFRKNMFDWDYTMNIMKFAPVVRNKHYFYWRNNGIAFEMRVNKYKFPNRTLSNYIEGRSKSSKDSCMVRGFWGDLVNSPYISFGVELEKEDEHKYFYNNNSINYLRDSQDITEFNLVKMIWRLDHNEEYDYMKRAYQKEQKRKEAAAKAQEKEENEKNKDKTKAFKIENEDNTLDKITEKLKEHSVAETAVQEEDHDIELNLKKDSNGNEITYDVNELLQGFRDVNFRMVFIGGDIDKNIYKKKKFVKLFDVILYGFHGTQKFNENQKNVIKDNTYVLYELNTMMASFTEEQRKEYAGKVKEWAGKNGLIIDNTSRNYIHQYKVKPIIKEEEVEEEGNDVEIIDTSVPEQ